MVKSIKPIDLGNRIHVIDGFDLGVSGRTGTYVIQEKELTIVETGSSPAIPHVLKGLQDLELDPKDIKYIIVTHIHLDHSGGAGLLLENCPNATVIVHPKGARHLAHPERLIQGAKAVYGDKFERLFEPILPVPEERIVIKEDGDTLMIGPDCTLQFLDTPGHANHHFSIYDPVSNGIFSGDTIGIRYHQVEDIGFTFYLPTTSPNQFNPALMKESMERIRKLNVERIYFGHFGMSDQVEEVYKQLDEWIPVFVETASDLFQQGKGESEISAALLRQVRQHLQPRRVPDDHGVYDVLRLDLDVCSMGLVDYLRKHQNN